VIKNLLI